MQTPASRATQLPMQSYQAMNAYLMVSQAPCIAYLLSHKGSSIAYS